MIRAIHEAAFGRPDEADLVEHLHNDNAVLVSLVAEVDAPLASPFPPEAFMALDLVSGALDGLRAELEYKVQR